MSSFRRLPRAVREQDILDAAVATFSRLGYHAASVDEIADVAGVSKPMVYAYVGTKEELFVACLHREGVRLMEALAAAAGRGTTPRDRLREGLGAFFDFVGEHRDGWTVLYGQARGQESFAEVIASLRALMGELIIGLFTAAAAPATDPADVTALGHLVLGAAEELADRIAAGLETEAPPNLADRLTRLVWLGAASLLNP